ncbi:hypothetical protein OK016_24700 [Vibrio chagasii]|nr:hypothetical protein [Vibrio chagasii]
MIGVNMKVLMLLFQIRRGIYEQDLPVRGKYGDIFTSEEQSGTYGSSWIKKTIGHQRLLKT